jgi:hypothetical protein
MTTEVLIWCVLIAACFIGIVLIAYVLMEFDQLDKAREKCVRECSLENQDGDNVWCYC